MLRCKTPEMLEKEIWVHLLAYNLIRLTMAEAASLHGKNPRQLSFKGAIQAINIFVPRIQLASANQKKIFYKAMLQVIASNIVGNRPGRREPRAIKRRPKPFPKLHISRQKWKQKHAST